MFVIRSLIDQRTYKVTSTVHFTLSENELHNMSVAVYNTWLILIPNYKIYL